MIKMLRSNIIDFVTFKSHKLQLEEDLYKQQLKDFEEWSLEIDKLIKLYDSDDSWNQ